MNAMNTIKIEQIYEELCRAIKDKTLTIRQDVCNGLFAHLLRSLSQEAVTVADCTAQLGGGQITVHGAAEVRPYASFGPQTFSAVIRIENDQIKYEAQLVVNGCGMLKELCRAQGIHMEEDSLFARFGIQYPVLHICSDQFVSEGGYQITGTACIGVSHGLDAVIGLISESMPFTGNVQKAYGQNYCQINFMTGKNDFVLPLGQASAVLAMRTMNPQPLFQTEPEAYAYLLFEIHSGRGAGMKFQMAVSTRMSKKCFAAAYFHPVLTPANVETYVWDLFGIPGESLLLPEDAAVSNFGLQKIELRLNRKGTKLTEGFELENIKMAFCLDQPWDTPVQGLKLDEFGVFPEVTLWEGQQITTLTVSAAASLTFGAYCIKGRLKGCFPQQEYEGSLALYQNEEQHEQLTLADLAGDFQAPVPDAWAKPLADFHIYAKVLEHSYELTASAEGIVSIQIGSLKISIDRVMVDAKVHPAGNEFSFSGLFGFGTGEDRFQFEVNASYDQYWTFSGALTEGKISIAKLFAAMFKTAVSPAAADIIIDGLSVSFAPFTGELRLFASFGICWFEVLGIRPKLGGRVKIVKKQDDSLAASALFYLDIGALHFLVQADDFYTEHIRFLFRVSIHKVYVQGIYSKEKGDEIVRLSLGGMTFGDLVLAFIHLLNPNAKSYLSSPWDILNKINLSDIEVVINATQETAAVLYHINISIAGLMQIKDIGVKYEKKEQKVSYIVTGSLLDQTYDIGNPISWDAVDGAPPQHAAAGETKTKVSYLGLGSHLQVDTSSGSVAEALKKLKEQLKPSGSSAPDISYSDKNDWMFGADITIGDLFRLQMVLIDPALYGAAITVDVSEKSPLFYFNGLALELVYQKISDTVGMFRCSVTLPKTMSRLELGVLTVMLGQISVEIYTNGSFLIDLGFPHNGDFSKSFGLEYGIFTGRGGVYFGVLEGDAVKQVPETKNGAFTPVVLLGIGLCIGVGRSFDLGVVKGGVSLTVTGILEGAFAVFHPSDASQKEAVYYRVSAAAGIRGTLFLSVDFKIISISAAAEISAVCSFCMESYRQSVLRVSLYLRLAASIKILFIKISFSFTFQQEVSFAFGEDRLAPWELMQEQTRSVPAAGSLKMFPCVTVGDWKLRVSLLPLFSVKHPDMEREPSYCAAFLCVVSGAYFADMLQLLLAWILAAFDQDEITKEDAKTIPEQAQEILSYEMLDAFFAKNIHITVDTETDEQAAGFTEGVFFPMLPCLNLTCEGTKICYSKNFVTEEYCQKINEYFASLNADPFHEVQVQDRCEDSVPVSINEAIFTDYIKMIVSQLLADVKRQFQGITMEADSFGQITEQYDVDAELFLENNPNLLLHIDRLAKYTYVTVQGDTLQDLQERFALDARQLWEDLAHNAVIPAYGQSVLIKQYVFDNRLAQMTVKEAAAVFFVRLYDPQVSYARYARQLVEDQALEADWYSGRYGSRRFLVPGWSREYTALAGDNVVRVAKAAALVNGEAADGWDSFLERFCKDHPKMAAEYDINETAAIKDRTLQELLLRICPDITEFSEKNVLWNQPVISPWKDVLLTDARVGLKNVTPAQAGMPITEIAQALSAHTADLACAQTVTAVPCKLSKAQIQSLVLTSEKITETGAMISRFFLQGLRVPAPDSEQMSPLFEVLRQQIDVAFKEDAFRFSVEKNPDAACVWTDGVSGGEVFLCGEKLKQALPEGRLAELSVLKKLEDFSEAVKCWSVTDTQILLNKNMPQMLCAIPQDLRIYLEQNSTDSVVLKCAGKEQGDVSWASLIELPLVRAGKNSYRFQGAAVQQRRELYAFLNSPVIRLRFLCRTSRLDTNQAEYAQIDTQSCLIVRSDLSTKTHFEAARSNAWSHMAGMDDPQQFLLLVWEGSVIGGGFWIVCSDIPDSIFQEDGRGSIYMLTEFAPNVLSGSYLNRVVLCGPAHDLVFEGNAQRMRVPDFPAGSVGIYGETEASKGSRMQELFQILGYTVTDADGRMMESMPVLPQQQKDAPADADQGMYYRTGVPLYRLCEHTDSVDTDSVYAAVGKTFQLHFFRRDVLGNTADAGTLTVTPDYNDFLLDLNQIPFTSTEYVVKKNGSKIQAGVRLSFSISGPQEREMITSAVQAQARRVMQQAFCEIEICFTPTFAMQAGYTLNADDMTAYRSFTKAVCDALCQPFGMCGAAEREVLIVWDLCDCGAKELELPQELFEIALTAKITRSLAKCGDSGIKYAECMIARADSFASCFAEAMPQILLAEGNGKLYGIPKQVYFTSFSIAPFSYEAGGQTVRSPELYAAAPFSAGLVTGTVQVEEEAVTFTDIDIEAWMKCFLEDMERLLSGERLAQAAVLCPQELDQLIETKGKLAQQFAGRIVPLVNELSADGMQTARETAVQLYKKSLEYVYDMDVMCVYQAAFQCSKNCRLESVLSGSDTLHAGKADSQQDYYCVYSTQSNAEKNSDTKDLQLSFLHFEYEIQPGLYGYEDSKWLRFVNPLRPDGERICIDLEAELGIPHPRKLFPQSPVLLAQSCSSKQSALLRYSYTVRMSCRAVEQDTVYLRLRFLSDYRSRAGGMDPVFETLAVYDRKREEMLSHIADMDGEFVSAYRQVGDFAKQLNQAMEQMAVCAAGEKEAAEQCREFTVKLAFQNLSNPSAASTICAEPYDEESKKFADIYKIQLTTDILSELHAGEELVFAVNISNLPIYCCPQVISSAWIVQNEDLLRKKEFTLNPAFIFRTEEVFLEPLTVCADYALKESAADFQKAAEKLWQLLEISDTARPSVAAACSFRLETTPQRSVPLRLPAVFLPQAAGPKEVSDALERWLLSLQTDERPAEVDFQAHIYERQRDIPVVSAQVCISLQ